MLKVFVGLVRGKFVREQLACITTPYFDRTRLRQNLCLLDKPLQQFAQREVGVAAQISGFLAASANPPPTPPPHHRISDCIAVDGRGWRDPRPVALPTELRSLALRVKKSPTHPAGSAKGRIRPTSQKWCIFDARMFYIITNTIRYQTGGGSRWHVSERSSSEHGVQPALRGERIGVVLWQKILTR
jgi:hypothetical protein